MDVKIIETGKVVKLEIRDENNIDWSSDLIGNSGATIDGQFVFDREEEIYLASAETVEWWQNYIRETNATDDDVRKLAQELNISESDIRERISENTDGDYNYHRRQAQQAMAELREEYSNAE